MSAVSQAASGPRELVAHAGPGSGPHRMLQALARGLGEALNVPAPQVSVRPGNDGAQAILSLADHTGDATLAGSCTPTYFTTPLKRGLSVTYRDLTPLAGLVGDTYLLVVRADHPAGDATELLAVDTTAAAAPKGGNSHIQAMLLDDVTRGTITVAFYQDIPAATQAVCDGRADWTTGVSSDFRAVLEDGRLRIVASFAAEGEAVPPTPSLREQGINVEFPLWRGLIGPPGLDDESIARWSAWVRAGIDTAAWRAYLDEARLRSAYLSSQEFARLLDAEASRYEDWSARLAAS